jgi:L-lactate dehydrogenase complex protein LldG
MTTAREDILNAIRQNRALAGLQPEDGHIAEPLVLPPPRQPGSPQEEMERLFKEIGLLSGQAQTIARDDLSANLRDLVRSESIRKAVVWDTPRLVDLGIPELLTSTGVEVIPCRSDYARLAECDLGITGVDFALPETGTLVLGSSGNKPRSVSLLPRVHLAILEPSVLRADLHQVFAEAKGFPYLIFVTGPSRTSDIEMVVTLGVHGPKSLYAWNIP